MINFINLDRQMNRIKTNIDGRLTKVLASSNFILGPEVRELEIELEKYTGAKHCISCGNGTDALQIALMAIGIKKNDEIIIPGFNYISAIEVINLLNAKPVIVDIDIKTFNVDPTKIEAHITSKTKAIIATSLFGLPADFKKINLIAKKYGLIVIEDAAQSFGASIGAKKVMQYVRHCLHVIFSH
jgi:UDP-2-acetamido-2-deoxy-ribo-hexuluronate aminotransferase